MKILCLYNNECAVELFNWLKSKGHETVLRMKRLDVEWCRENKFDLTVSYTYRFILAQEMIDALGNNVVNLHNSYLPWNKGADPNIWSILEDSPRGVTLHYVNEGIDQGDIIAQQLVADENAGATLASTYNDLDRAAKQLFMDAFAYYDSWREMRKAALGSGSYHRSSDLSGLKGILDSYEIKVHDFKAEYLELTRRKPHGGVLPGNKPLFWLEEVRIA